MANDTFLTSADIRLIFAEEISASGGRVSDAFDDGRRLFSRAILPWTREVTPRDVIHAGVAIRATEEEAWIHPYLFREVCTNGAIWAQSLESRQVRCLDLKPSEEARLDIVNAVRGCCDENVFADCVHEIRWASRTPMDLALTMMPFISQAAEQFGPEFATDILDRYMGGGDRTLFGLMNAVTSRARDTEDPEVRWRLEELGGGVPAICVTPNPVRRGSAAAELAVA